MSTAGLPRWSTTNREYVLLRQVAHVLLYLSGAALLAGGAAPLTTPHTAAGHLPRARGPVVAIDMCSIYACAVRRMLPARSSPWTCSTSCTCREDDRLRAPPVPRKYGAAPVRTPSTHQEPAVRNLEQLSGAQFAKIISILQPIRRQEIAAA